MAGSLLILLHALGIYVLVKFVGSSEVTIPPGGYSPTFVKNSLTKAEIIPDVIDTAPEQAIKIKYSDTAEVKLGNNLTQSDINVAPKEVEWPAKDTSLYTLIMTDPDVPCRKWPTQREWVHWMIANIPGNNWKKGRTVCRYINPQRAVGKRRRYDDYIENGTRYVFLVYKQPDNKPVDYKDMEKDGSLHRLNFSVRAFAKEHSLGDPVAVNFFEIPLNETEKEETRKRDEWFRYNRKHPPTRTAPPTTPSYRDMNPNPYQWW